MDKLMDVQAVAEHLSISPFTVRLYIKKGKLNAIKIGRRVLCDPASVQKFIDEAKAGPSVPNTSSQV